MYRRCCPRSFLCIVVVLCFRDHMENIKRQSLCYVWLIFFLVLNSSIQRDSDKKAKRQNVAIVSKKKKKTTTVSSCRPRQWRLSSQGPKSPCFSVARGT